MAGYKRILEYQDRRDKRRGWPASVYLIADDFGHCKIGVSRDPAARRGVLQSSYPYRLMIHQTWVIETEDEARPIEAILLSRCARHRLLGEWIKADPWPVQCWMTSVIWRAQKSAAA